LAKSWSVGSRDTKTPHDRRLGLAGLRSLFKHTNIELLLSYGCRHLRAAKKCLYGSEKAASQLCEANDSILNGDELAFDFICDDGYSGMYKLCVGLYVCLSNSVFPKSEVSEHFLLLL